jgi:hypothetical protein
VNRTVRRRRDGRDERGLALIFVSLLMIVMLLFAAFAIDFGALYNHRRLDQNAADSAALAAAQDLGGPVSQMVATAKDYAEETLGESFTAAEWNSCGADGGSLPNLAPGSNCISYSGDRVRVRIPDQQYDTFFAGVAGVDNMRHSAFAVAGLQLEGLGGVLPFGVATPAPNGYGCLQSASGGHASSTCSGPTAGNFRFLDFSVYNADPPSCADPGQQDDRLRQNMAMGIDHTVSRYGTTYTVEVLDHEACAASPQIQAPNTVQTRTGNQSNDATVGLFSGTSADFPDGRPARLARHDDDLFGGNAPSPIDVLGVQDLDNVPLWDFIPAGYGPGQPTPADIPHSCVRSQFVDTNGNFSIANTPDAVRAYLAGRSQGDQSIALLQRCIDHWRGQNWTGAPVGTISIPEPSTGCAGTCDDPVFARNTVDDDPEVYDIQYTSRFGYVPELNSFGSGVSSPARMLRFRAVYIQRLFFTRPGSDVNWDPGVSPAPPTTSGGNVTLAETTMWVMPNGILPNGLADENAPFEPGANRFVRLLR